MFFNLSKVFWFVANPGNILFFMICVTCFLVWLKWFRAVRFLITLVVIVLTIISVAPIGSVIINHLENRFTRADPLPKNIAGIIVLGGVIDQYLTADRQQISINSAVERLTEFARLAKIYPDVKLIFSGGSGILGQQELKEADFVKQLLLDLGMNLEKIIFENQSRNTAENASYVKKLIKPNNIQPWILITSAFHMPRAIASFRQQEWNVIAYPVDYRTPFKQELKFGLNLISGLSSFSLALHECMGLLFYWISGLTNELYPKS
jgi:uncharacterized SAM-binding protein YcdF (DUF218 family)